MDEIDAIGGRRFSEGTSADREIQRTLMVYQSTDICICRIIIHSRFVGIVEPNGRL
jgi:hypothetical protein